MAKNLALGPILAHIWSTKVFFKYLAPSVTRYHGQLSSGTIPENANDPILTKLVTDGRTDGQEIFHRMLPTNAKRPKTSV